MVWTCPSCGGINGNPVTECSCTKAFKCPSCGKVITAPHRECSCGYALPQKVPVNRKKIGLYLFISALVFLYQAYESANKLGISNGKTIMLFVITSLFSLIGLFCVLTARPPSNEKMVQTNRRGILLPVVVGVVVLLCFNGINYYKGIMLGKAESILRTKYTPVDVRSIEWSKAEIPRDINSPYAQFGGDKQERAWKINADIKDAHGKAVRCEVYLSIIGELVIVWPLEVMKVLKSGAKAP